MKFDFYFEIMELIEGMGCFYEYILFGWGFGVLNYLDSSLVVGKDSIFMGSSIIYLYF